MPNHNTFSSARRSNTPMEQEHLSREEAVLILRSTADYLEGCAAVTQNAAHEYRLRTLASKYRQQALGKGNLDHDTVHV